jgi:hypothetical protein
MATTETVSSEGAIWNRIVKPDRRDLAPEAAQAILNLDFEEGDRKRMRELAAKAREGELTASEKEAIANYERVGSVLSLMKAKARRSLDNGSEG